MICQEEGFRHNSKPVIEEYINRGYWKPNKRSNVDVLGRIKRFCDFMVNVNVFRKPILQVNPMC